MVACPGLVDCRPFGPEPQSFSTTQLELVSVSEVTTWLTYFFNVDTRQALRPLPSREVCQIFLAETNCLEMFF